MGEAGVLRAMKGAISYFLFFISYLVHGFLDRANICVTHDGSKIVVPASILTVILTAAGPWQ